MIALHPTPPPLAKASGGLLTSAPPVASTLEAERILRQHFGIEGIATRLAAERDLLFRLTCDSGTAVVLKLINAAETDDALDLQISILTHIADNDPGLLIPRALHSLNGRTIEIVEDGDGLFCRATLSTFIEGNILDPSRLSLDDCVALGALIARLHSALDGFHPAGADRSTGWNLSDAARSRGAVQHVNDAITRGTINDVFDDFERIALPGLASLSRQMIHGDLNPHNIVALVPPRTGFGVIDFGDAVSAPCVNDIAIACSYLIARTSDPLSGVRVLVSAYHVQRPLTAHEIDLLALLIATRCAQSIAIAAWRAQLWPDNSTYILRNMERAVDALNALTQLGSAEAHQQIVSACAGRSHG